MHLGFSGKDGPTCTDVDGKTGVGSDVNEKQRALDSESNDA